MVSRTCGVYQNRFHWWKCITSHSLFLWVNSNFRISLIFKIVYKNRYRNMIKKKFVSPPYPTATIIIAAYLLLPSNSGLLNFGRTKSWILNPCFSSVHVSLCTKKDIRGHFCGCLPLQRLATDGFKPEEFEISLLANADILVHRSL